MDESEVFGKMKSELLKAGGIFDHVNDELIYKADFGLYYNLIINVLSLAYQALPKKPASLRFTYVDNLLTNASAIKDGDLYCITINTGLVYLLERLFNSMLCNPRVFSVVGNAKDEKPHDKIDICFYKSVAFFINKMQAT